jgi:hypothetical protein
MHTTHSNTIIWIIVVLLALFFIFGSGYRSRSYQNDGYTRTPSSTYESSSSLSASAYSATTVISNNAIRLQTGQVCNRALYYSEGVCVAMQ